MTKDPLTRAVLLASETPQGEAQLGGDAFAQWTLLLTSPRPDKALRHLHEVGYLRKVFPELEALVGFGGSAQGHKDLWEHTLQVVRQADAAPQIRWAALWHDVGKIEAFSRETGKVSFHKHEYISARLFRTAMERTRLLTGDFYDKVHFLVKNLGLVESYEAEWTDSAVRRLHKELGVHFEDTLTLARADVTSKHAHKRDAVQRKVDELRSRALAIAAADAIVPPLPKGIGQAIMEAFGIPPSKQVGVIKAYLEAQIEAAALEGHQPEDYYVRFLQESGFVATISNKNP